MLKYKVGMKKALALDIGGTNTRLAIVNEKNEIERILIKPTICSDKNLFMQNIMDCISEFNLDDVVAIGAGVPGVVDREKGEIIDLPNVFVKDIPFKKIIEEKFHKQVFLRNDAEVACLGEALSPLGKKYQRVLFITISTGLGVSLCVDQEIQNYVTEVGHTLTYYKDNYYEYSILAGIKFPIFAELNGIGKISPKEFFSNIQTKTEYQKVLKEWISFANNFLDLMINSYRPELIVFTGGLMNNKDLFLSEFKAAHPEVRMEECYFKTNAGLVGAGRLALQQAKTK